MMKIVHIYLVNVIFKDKKLKFVIINLNWNIMEKWKVLNYLKMQYLLYIVQKNLKVKNIELNKHKNAWIHYTLGNENYKYTIIILVLFYHYVLHEFKFN